MLGRLQDACVGQDCAAAADATLLTSDRRLAAAVLESVKVAVL